MARRAKFYRKTYRYLFLYKKDLQRFIKLLQTHCDALIILIDDMHIEHSDQLDLLSGPLASEIIITGLALHPTIVDAITGVSPSLQLRITGQNARLFVCADARKDFQELINQIDSMFIGNIDISRVKMLGSAQTNTLGANMGIALSSAIIPLGALSFNDILFWAFNCLCLGLSAGAIFWIWNRLANKIAPSCILSLDDTQAKAVWTRRKCLDIVGIMVNLAMLIGILALRHFFWVQFGFHSARKSLCPGSS